jgi:quercetin dioxygenase-like cupin family protein
VRPRGWASSTVAGRRSALLACALAATIAGCANGERDPSGEPIPFEEDAAARPEPEVEKPAREWLGQWSAVKGRLEAAEEPVSEVRLQRGLFLEAVAFRVAEGALEAPAADPAAEALIVMEGTGSLQLATGVESLEPGTVALLPRGARGAVTSAPGQALLGLLLRGRLKVDGGEVRVLRDRQVFPDEVTQPRAGNAAHVLGDLPGLTVRVVGVSGEIPRHFHARHDEFVVMISGRGGLGLGSEGGARSFVVQRLQEEGLVFVPAATPHSYSDASAPVGRTLAFSIHGPSHADPSQDTFVVEEPQKAAEPAKAPRRRR